MLLCLIASNLKKNNNTSKNASLFEGGPILNVQKYASGWSPSNASPFWRLVIFLSFSDIIVNVVNFTNRDVVRSNIAKIFVTLYDVFDEYKKSDSYYQAKIDELTSGMF